MEVGRPQSGLTWFRAKLNTASWQAAVLGSQERSIIESLERLSQREDKRLQIRQKWGLGASVNQLVLTACRLLGYALE